MGLPETRLKSVQKFGLAYKIIKLLMDYLEYYGVPSAAPLSALLHHREAQGHSRRPQEGPVQGDGGPNHRTH